jgi:dTDP-4-amino-4,6-dideoxygalactose transaminase
VSATTVATSTSGAGHRARRAWGTIRAHWYRVPYCVPQWSAWTLAAIVRCVATGRVVHGPAPALLARRLAAQMGVPAALPCGGGRSAIELALRALDVGSGDDVIVPAFCCTSIVPPILAVGAQPVLADVGPELNLTPDTIESALTPRTRAVIVPHLFGNPADIEAIDAFCAARGLKLIDDAAQAMGATVRDRPAGTFGDAGLVSFGKGKICFGTGGGALVSRRPEIIERATRLELPPARPRETLTHALSVLVWRRGRRWFLPAQAALARLRRPRQALAPYGRRAMTNLDAAVAGTLLDRLPGDLRARRERVAAYRRALAGEPALTLVLHRPGSACLTQVVMVDPANAGGAAAARVVGALREKGYEVDTSYTPLHLRGESGARAHGPLARTDAVWQSLVELPCEPSVSMAEIDRIAATVRAAVGRD